MSILKTMSTAGKTTRPLVIFKGVNLQSTWFEEDTPNWLYTSSENGWTANRITVSWLNVIFLLEIKPKEALNTITNKP